MLSAFTTFIVAQPRLTVTRIDTSQYPRMSASFYLFDNSRNPVYSTLGDLTVRENGTSRTVLSVTCPPPSSPRTVSAAMSIDISGSMGTVVAKSGARSVDLAKRTADLLSSAVPLPPNELALQICDTRATLLQDFTSDVLKIRGQIPFISAGGGNDFKTHLLNPLTGLLNIAKNGRNNRVAILFTDAMWVPLEKAELQACIDTCAKYNIRFFAVLYSSLTTSPKGIKVSFEQLAEATGGAMIDGITESDAIGALVDDLIMLTSKGSKPCTIEWLAENTCANTTSALITSLPIGVESSLTYPVPQRKKSTVAAVQKSIVFGGVPPLTSRDTTVEFVARNSDVTISAARMANPLFTFPDGFTPRTLKQGDTLRLRVRFTAADSVKTITELQLTTNACSTETVYLGAGYPGALLSSELQLIKPNGGELFIPKRDTVIQWTGVFPEDTVLIEYSTDAGTSWNFLTYANGLRWRWNVPFTPSESCLVRVSTAIVNPAQKLMTTDWVIMDMKYSRSGNIIVACGSGVRNGIQGALVWIIDRITGQRSEIQLPQSSQNLFAMHIDITPDERAFVVSNYDTVYCYSLSGTIIWQRTLARSGINISADGREVLFGQDVLSMTDGSTLRSMNGLGRSILSPKGTYVYLPGFTSFIQTICRYSDGQIISQYQRFSSLGTQYRTACFSNDESKFAVALNDSIVVICRTSDGKELLSFRSSTTNYSMCFSRNDSMLIIANHDQTVKFWSTLDGSFIGLLRDTTKGFGLVAAHPNGRYIAGATGNIMTSGSSQNRNHTIVEWNADRVAIGAQSNSRTRLWYPRVTIDTKRPVLQSILSRDGQRVVVVEERSDVQAIPTNTNPRRATMYDANTGKALFTLDTALNLRNVAMSWNGNYIAAVFFSPKPDSNNHYATIYDARTGRELENTLLDLPGTSVCFHPSDSAIAIGQPDGELLLRPLYFRSNATGIDIQFDQLPEPPKVPILSCAFNAEGTRIGYVFERTLDRNSNVMGMLTHSDSVAPLFRGTTFTPLRTPPRILRLCRQNEFLSSDFSADNRTPVVVGNDSSDGRPTTLGGIDGNYDIVHTRLIRYNRNATMLLHSEDTLSVNTKNGAGKWGRAVLYDVPSRKPFAVLHGKHRGLITDASFSANSDVIATGGFELQSSGDSSGRVIIWQRSPAAFDVSDSLFTILGPRARMREIDMGTVRVGSLRDSVVTQLVCNIGRLPVQIDSVVIQAPAAAGFSVLGGVPVTIDTNFCALIELRFKPTAAQSFTGTVIAYTSAGELQTRIIGNATEQLFRVPDTVIDLGKVEVGSQKDSIIIALFKNTSAIRRANLTSLRCTFPDSTQFTVDNPTTASVAAGDSLNVKLIFAPQKLGRASTMLRIDATYETPTTAIEPIYVQLFGEGICAAAQAGGGLPYRIGFDSPEIATTTGTNLNLVVRIVPPPGVSLSALPADADITFSVPTTTVYPLAPATTNSIANDVRSMQLRATRSGDTLAILPLKTMLGNSDTARVRIESVDFGGSCRPMLALDSTLLRFTDICQAGGAPRLVSTAPLTALMITPNPVGTSPTLHYTLAEATDIRINIYDLLGTMVQQIDVAAQQRGTHTLPIDVSQLGSGVYRATLTTRSQHTGVFFTKW